jgi:chaperonin GroEL (HSP60 family)
MSIDPSKVDRVALQSAASIASLLLTTEVLITSSAKSPAKHTDGMLEVKIPRRGLHSRG